MIRKIDWKIHFLTAIYSLLFLTGFFFTPLSSAKIHMEPYAGWSLTFTNSAPIARETFNKTNSAIKYARTGRYYTGPTAGMRLGYSSLGLAVGVDLNLGYWKSLYKEESKDSRNKETIVPTLPGLFVSYKLPVLFRAYATLIPYARVQLENEQTNLTCSKSKGVKLGISYLSLPFISVNFEYMPLHIYGDNCNTMSHTGTAYVNFVF